MSISGKKTRSFGQISPAVSPDLAEVPSGHPHLWCGFWLMFFFSSSLGVELMTSTHSYIWAPRYPRAAYLVCRWGTQPKYPITQDLKASTTAPLTPTKHCPPSSLYSRSHQPGFLFPSRTGQKESWSCLAPAVNWFD